MFAYGDPQTNLGAKLAAFALGAEALIFAGFGIYSLVHIFGGSQDTSLVDLGLFLTCLAMAVLLGFAFRAVFRGKRFGATFGFTWQLFQAALSLMMIFQLHSPWTPLGVVLLVLTALGMFGVMRLMVYFGRE